MNSTPFIADNCRQPLVPSLSKEQGCSRIASIIRGAFEGVRNFFSVPTRYFGSKTWSIPGVICRAPYLVFKKIFSSQKFSFKEELLQPGYQFSAKKDLTKEELKPYYPHACAPCYNYALKEENIPDGWKLARDTWYNPQSGLKISFLQKGDELMLPIGSIEAKELAPKRNKCIRQSLLGQDIEIFKEADKVFADLSSDPLLKGKKVTLVGACFGAAIASYVALKHKTPAVCFNSFPMGVAQQQDVGNERLREASKYVTHISAKGCYTSDMPAYRVIDRGLSALGFRIPGWFGNRFRIPSAYSAMQDTHAYFIGSVMEHLGHDKRTKPVDLQNFIV
jgi:hypothetical protein